MCPFWPGKKPQSKPKHTHPPESPSVYFLVFTASLQYPLEEGGLCTCLVPWVFRGDLLCAKSLLLLNCSRNSKGKKHVRKGFWLVHLKAHAGLNRDALASSTALISHICAILHCRSDVGELSEHVICCAWALNLSPWACFALSYFLRVSLLLSSLLVHVYRYMSYRYSPLCNGLTLAVQ